jgi:hypothetical protein
MAETLEAPVRHVVISPHDRFAVIGRTRSGKTTFGTALAASMVSYDARIAGGWQVWFIDTKHDPRDLQALRRWGFEHGDSERVDRAKGPRIVFSLYAKGARTVKQQAAWLFKAAMQRHGVLVVIDEYKSVVVSKINAGPELDDLFERGGGLEVGTEGFTQEPCGVPRGLFSQATHVFLFDLWFRNDLKLVREMFGEYRRPAELGYPHGFYAGYVGDGQWQFYRHSKDYFDKMGVPK